jgi:signal peptidase II
VNGRLQPASLAALALASLVLISDQLSKLLALQHLPLGVSSPFVPGLLRLQRVGNSGAAFSLLSGNNAALSVLSTAICLALVFWLVRHPPQSSWQILAFGFLLGGAAGNGLDRLRLGEVVDFLELVPIHFPIFNLADVAINLAVLCFAIDILRDRQRRADS